MPEIRMSGIGYRHHRTSSEGLFEDYLRDLDADAASCAGDEHGVWCREEAARLRAAKTVVIDHNGLPRAVEEAADDVDQG